MSTNQNGRKLYGIRPDASNCDTCPLRGKPLTRPGQEGCTLRQLLSDRDESMPTTEGRILRLANRYRVSVTQCDEGTKLHCPGPNVEPTRDDGAKGVITIYTDDSHRAKAAMLRVEDRWAREDASYRGGHDIWV